MYHILVNLQTVSRECIRTKTTRLHWTNNGFYQKINYFFENYYG